MHTEPNDEITADPRIRVASLIADTRKTLAELGNVSRSPAPKTRAAHVEALLTTLADAAAAAIAEPVAPFDVLPGDVLVHDGAEITVTGIPRPGMYPLDEVRQFGWAVDWRGGANRRGTMFRLASDVLCRLPKVLQVPGQAAPLDSEGWRCGSCKGEFIGRRPAGEDVCEPCRDLAAQIAPSGCAR